MPVGCGMLDGTHDHLSKRVDLTTGQIVDYQPPQPSGEHEWNGASRRWEKRLDVLEREWRRSAAIQEREQLERQQLRSMSDLWVDSEDSAARQHFLRRKTRIDELRSIIGDETETTGR